MSERDPKLRPSSEAPRQGATRSTSGAAASRPPASAAPSSNAPTSSQRADGQKPEFHWVPPEPPPPDNSIPPTTWWIVGAGVAVLLFAGAFVWLGSHPGDDVASVPPAPDPDEELDEPATNEATEPAAPIALPPDPLNLTKLGLDARARSRAWNSDAAIARVRIDIDDGRPIGSIEFEYGVPQGPLVPGVALRPERHFVSVPAGSGEVTERDGRATEPQKALTEPNCPFDIAFQKLIQSGVAQDQRISAEYIFSARHARPVFQFTTADARQHVIDANQCQVVVR